MPHDGSCPLQLKVTHWPHQMAAAWQVSVGAGGMDGQGFDRGQRGLKVEIDQGKVDLCARIPLLLGWPAGGMPEGLLLFAVSCVFEGVEGLESASVPAGTARYW